MSTPAGDPTLQPVSAEAVESALLRAVQRCAENGSGAQAGEEAQRYGAAALSFAQAWRALGEPLVPPVREPGGDRPQSKAS